jgi:hypothetical protein
VRDWTEPDVEQDSPKRRPYQAPQVGQVDLRADEVLVAGCKTPKSGAASRNHCWGPAVCSKIDVS